MQIGTLIKSAKTYLPSLDEEAVRTAYEFARDAHKGQKRMDGSPYITHPLSAALVLTRLQVDQDTLIACLLHDVPEDTEFTIKDVEKKFGKKIAFLVDGVTKLSKMKYRDDMVARQIQSLKKFFLHSAKDLRIILIKLADRLHNMGTLDFVRPDKQERIAKETMEIYVPIADLLGIWEVKSKLEDLCFKYLYPKEFEELSTQMKRSHLQHQRLLKETTKQVQHLMKQHGIEADIESRPKTLYSIFRKMVDTGRQLSDLNDLLALRVITEQRVDCYKILGIIHSLFRPKSGRIKDYIAVPKANGYQSLHTTVFGIDGTPTEFQLRTHEMHFDAQFGIAAHYFYKQRQKTDNTESDEVIRRRSAWVQKVLDLQKELKSNYDFIENLKLDVLQDRIFVFTPKGDVIDLPQGANGIDFSYHIHTHVGDHAVGMYRNGKESPITTTLQTGDTVKVIISKRQKYPRREWLNKVKTNLARNKIRDSLKDQPKAKIQKEGLNFLEKELHRYAGSSVKKLSSEQKEHLIHIFEVTKWEEFIEQIGLGIISEHDFLEALYTKDELLGTPCRTERGYKTPLSKIQYRGNGTRLVGTLKSQTTPYFRVKLGIESDDRVGLLRDMGMNLANVGVNIYQIGVRPGDESDQAWVDLVIEVMDLKQLKKAFDSIETVDGVLHIHRIIEDQTLKPKRS
jgi:GTP diphosphokinase / guanosine-3',5'-bis(diphosphate) 3'-diphosphatase